MPREHREVLSEKELRRICLGFVDKLQLKIISAIANLPDDSNLAAGLMRSLEIISQFTKDNQ